MGSERRGIVFADIDGTLIGSRRDRDVSDVTVAGGESDDVAATNVHGTPIAWRTTRQRALWSWLARLGDIVAVTGRSVGAYGRVRLPFAPHAIVHHGAVVLGSEASAFRELTRPLLEESAPVLREAGAALASLADIHAALLVTTQTIDGLVVEVCVKHRDHVGDRGTMAGAELPTWANDIESAWRGLSFTRVHRNGNNLALLPARVTKDRAMRWLRERVYADVDLTIGVGDSTSDYGFMSACDVSLIPSGSQLDALVRAAGGLSDDGGRRG